jgi:hypothetical protein
LQVRPQKNADWERNSRDLGDEFLAYDRGANQVHVLNATAREIFIRCDGEQTLEQISSAISTIYACDPQIVLQDLMVTIDRLVSLGLIEIEGELENEDR